MIGIRRRYRHGFHCSFFFLFFFPFVSYTQITVQGYRSANDLSTEEWRGFKDCFLVFGFCLSRTQPAITTRLK